MKNILKFGKQNRIRIWALIPLLVVAGFFLSFGAGTGSILKVRAMPGNYNWNRQSASGSAVGGTVTATCNAGTYVFDAITSRKPSGCGAATSTWPASTCYGASSCSVTDSFSCGATYSVTILCAQ